MNNEEQISKIVQEIYQKNATSREFSVSTTNFHTHNGTDSQRVKQNDLINGTTSIISLNIFATETDILDTIQNVTQITLNGIASNNYGQAVSQKAVLNGHAQLGNCFNYSQTTVNSTHIKTIGNYKPFLQTFDSMFIDTTDLTKAKVGAGAGHFVYVLDGGGNVVAQIDIIKWTGTSIILQTTLSTHWQVFLYLSMS